jgi:hypothetical protein
MLQVGHYTCPLDTSPRGAANDDAGLGLEEHQRLVDRERWLTETLRMIDRMGRPHRRAFDQLVIDINPDRGPAWLDTLLWCVRTGRDHEPAALASLALAIEALAIVARGA